MINKVAEMTRLAEVRGCMAAFHDAGLIKCASEDAFDDLCEKVAGQIGYDYDLEKVAETADLIIELDRKRQLAKNALNKTAGIGGAALGALRNAFTAKGIRNVRAGNRNARQLLNANVINPGSINPSDIENAQRMLSLGGRLKNYGKAAIAPALAYGGALGAAGAAGFGARKAYDAYTGE